MIIKNPDQRFDFNQVDDLLNKTNSTFNMNNSDKFQPRKSHFNLLNKSNCILSKSPKINRARKFDSKRNQLSTKLSNSLNPKTISHFNLPCNYFFMK